MESNFIIEGGMSDMALKPPATKDDNFELVEAGVHKGRCIKIIDLGTHEVTYNEEIQEKHKIMIMFELPESTMKDGRPFAVALFVNLSLHKKSKLRPLLVGWRGKDFTEDEAGDFDILKLLDVPALLNVIHNESDGITYANIQSIMPLKKSECPARVNDLTSFSLSDYDPAVLETLSEKLQKKIKSSHEFTKLVSADTEEKVQMVKDAFEADDNTDGGDESPF